VLVELSESLDFPKSIGKSMTQLETISRCDSGYPIDTCLDWRIQVQITFVCYTRSRAGKTDTSTNVADYPRLPHHTVSEVTLTDIPTNDPSPPSPSSCLLFKEQAMSPQTASPQMMVLYCPLH
jgi:hypothetical protein